ncbi:MAG: hypothetical protein DMG72_01785 [Acidobacteria bacterium]|nr:MAG: hypothetical protein DMG72_01785 [Acidobacteriota bacterium]
MSIPCAVAVLSFFIAGLLYLLCFEHVDNLGAYSIPSETGLLIPSDYNSQFCRRPGALEHAAATALRDDTTARLLLRQSQALTVESWCPPEPGQRYFRAARDTGTIPRGAADRELSRTRNGGSYCNAVIGVVAKLFPLPTKSNRQMYSAICAREW